MSERQRLISIGLISRGWTVERLRSAGYSVAAKAKAGRGRGFRMITPYGFAV